MDTVECLFAHVFARHPQFVRSGVRLLLGHGGTELGVPDPSVLSGRATTPYHLRRCTADVDKYSLEASIFYDDPDENNGWSLPLWYLDGSGRVIQRPHTGRHRPQKPLRHALRTRSDNARDEEALRHVMTYPERLEAAGVTSDDCVVCVIPDVGGGQPACVMTLGASSCRPRTHACHS